MEEVNKVLIETYLITLWLVVMRSEHATVQIVEGTNRCTPTNKVTSSLDMKSGVYSETCKVLECFKVNWFTKNKMIWP